MNSRRCPFGKDRVISWKGALLILGALLLSLRCQASAADRLPSMAEPGERSFKFSGEVKAIGSASWPGSDTLIQPEGSKTFYDGLFEGRLKGQAFFTDWVNVDIQDVIGITGGNTRQASGQSATPLFLSQGDLPGSPPSDDRQLLNMSWTHATGREFVAYDRVDRLALTLKKDALLATLGRQAITWGNGLIFNPMDLINPFGPTDVVREYKVGQDMAFAQVSVGSFANVQLLWAPRRDPDTELVKEEQSAYAVKGHIAVGNTDLDIVAAKNFGDKIIAGGANGQLGGAVWRADVLWTFPRDGNQSTYLSGVANLDYSWVWWGRNWYGYIEAYYNGAGKYNYGFAVNDTYIQRKINEGVLFTLGKWYGDTTVRVELHPLVNAYLTVISNVEDPSFIVQPRVSWDITRSLRLTAWGNIAAGRKGSEFGGFTVPGTSLTQTPPNGGFAWISYYF
jgi:hypothetical protein